MDGFNFVLCCAVSAVVGYFFGGMDRSMLLFKKPKKTTEKRKSFGEVKWLIDRALVIDPWVKSKYLTINDTNAGFFITKIPDVKSVEEYGYYLLKIFGYPIFTKVEEGYHGSGITVYGEGSSNCFWIKPKCKDEEQKELVDQFIKNLGAFFNAYIKKDCPIIDVKLDSEVDIIVARAKGVETDFREINAWRYGIA